MAKLTRSFTETITARLERDPAFHEALLTEADEQRQRGAADIAARLDIIRARIRRSLEDPRPDLSSQEVDAALEALVAQAKRPRED